jgi:hypothetical protein
MGDWRQLLLIGAFTAFRMSPQVQTIQAHNQNHNQSETEYCCRKGGPPAEIREKQPSDHDRKRYAQQEKKQFDDVHLNTVDALPLK